MALAKRATIFFDLKTYNTIEGYDYCCNCFSEPINAPINDLVVLDPSNISKWCSIIKNIIGYGDSEEFFNTTAAILRKIKNNFLLNITEMAELLNVSRPTVYLYLNDDDREPSENVDIRIERLNMIINLATEKGLRSPFRSLLFRRNSSNKMVKQLIADDCISRTDLERVIESEIELRKKMILISKTKNAKIQSVDEHSTTVYLED